MHDEAVQPADVAPPTASRQRNIFVIGLNDYQREHLEATETAERYEFHSLLPFTDLRGVHELPAAELVARAEARLQRFSGTVDGIVSFIDFPAVETVALLAARHGLRAPSLEAVLRCNHKYWSRILQAEAGPECVPAFAALDPMDESALQQLPLPPPMWLKPLNAFCSHLGFRVRNARDFRAGVARMRAELHRLADPLAWFMAQADVPEEIRRVGSHVCLAESLIGGRQCTLEGYVFEGEPVIYGIVDSIRETNRSSFARYQYPSRLPPTVRERMADVACRVMRHIGYDQGAFNMEFFYERSRDRVWLLEINPRLSLSHCELFEKVDGVSNQKVALDIARGRRPQMPHREGPFAAAAKFHLRAYTDATVVQVPDETALARIAHAVPGTTVNVLVRPGTRLSELTDQDAYSYELAHIWIGASSQRELLRRHRRVVSMLNLQLRATRRE